MPTMVLFQGEQCWIIDVREIQLFEGIEGLDLLDVLFELRPVEEAYVKGKFRRILVPKGAFTPLVGFIDFESSEWSQGVSNGQR